MSHVPCCEWVMSHVDESCPLLRVSHVSCGWVMSHMNKWCCLFSLVAYQLCDDEWDSFPNHKRHNKLYCKLCCCCFFINYVQSVVVLYKSCCSLRISRAMMSEILFTNWRESLHPSLSSKYFRKRATNYRALLREMTGKWPVKIFKLRPVQIFKLTRVSESIRCLKMHSFHQTATNYLLQRHVISRSWYRVV